MEPREIISFIKITICKLSRTVSHEFPKIQRKEFNDRAKRPINEIDRNPLTVPGPSPNLSYKNNREEKRRNENKPKIEKKTERSKTKSERPSPTPLKHRNGHSERRTTSEKGAAGRGRRGVIDSGGSTTQSMRRRSFEPA